MILASLALTPSVAQPAHAADRLIESLIVAGLGFGRFSSRLASLRNPAAAEAPSVIWLSSDHEISSIYVAISIFWFKYIMSSTFYLSIAIILVIIGIILSGKFMLALYQNVDKLYLNKIASTEKKAYLVLEPVVWLGLGGMAFGLAIGFFSEIDFLSSVGCMTLGSIFVGFVSFAGLYQRQRSLDKLLSKLQTPSAKSSGPAGEKNLLTSPMTKESSAKFIVIISSVILAIFWLIRKSLNSSK